MKNIKHVKRNKFFRKRKDNSVSKVTVQEDLRITKIENIMIVGNIQ